MGDMNLLQVVIIAIVEGLTEFLPVLCSKDLDAVKAVIRRELTHKETL